MVVEVEVEVEKWTLSPVSARRKTLPQKRPQNLKTAAKPCCDVSGGGRGRLADCKRVSRTRQIVQSLITGAIDVVILVPVTAHTQPKR